jgi:superfamily II DNA or RNA helicase
MSLSLYLQMAGRGLRIHPESAKRDCIILDHAGCAHAHGFVDEDREWGLEGKKKRSGAKREQPVRTCNKCFCAYPAILRVCPECGYSTPAEEHQIETDDSGKLVEITDEMRLQLAREKRREESRAQTLEDLQAIAKQRGYAPGWAYHRYQARLKRHA